MEGVAVEMEGGGGSQMEELDSAELVMGAGVGRRRVTS